MKTKTGRIVRSELYAAVGSPNRDKFPANFSGIFSEVLLPTCYPSGYVRATVVVRPSAPPVRPNGSKIKTSRHRAYVLCPDCQREIPAGRLHQHRGTGACT